MVKKLFFFQLFPGELVALIIETGSHLTQKNVYEPYIFVYLRSSVFPDLFMEIVYK